MEPGSSEAASRRGFDAAVAHPARVYDYWLGGKDNFAADREAAEQAIAAFPGLRAAVRAARAFLARSVRYVAGEAGVRQFLDVGPGIPAVDNTHEVAQRVAPDCRIVYVDNDPMVLSHARALLASCPEGTCAYVEADLRDTGAVLERAAETLDFSQPVAVMLVGILHLLGDEDDPYGIAARLMSAVPPGSYLVVSHPASDILEPEQGAEEAIRRYNELVAEKATIRTKPEVARFFAGLEVLDPGIVPANEWRPDTEWEAAARCAAWAGVARKP